MVDLTASEIGKIESQLQPIIDVARVARKSGRGRGSSKSSGDLRAVREWARSNGYTVSDRGRVPQEILDAYEAS